MLSILLKLKEFSISIVFQLFMISIIDSVSISHKIVLKLTSNFENTSKSLFKTLFIILLSFA